MNEDINLLSNQFKDISDVLTALGDKTREHIILKMLENGDCRGSRVGTIMQMANLSRPVVSHHLQVLNKAGIVEMHKEGIKNYCYFDYDDIFIELIDPFRLANDIVGKMPDRSGK